MPDDPRRMSNVSGESAAVDFGSLVRGIAAEGAAPVCLHDGDASLCEWDPSFPPGQGGWICTRCFDAWTLEDGDQFAPPPVDRTPEVGS